LLIDQTDSDAVMKLLQCSGSWADKLSAKAREAARIARDAEIIRLKDQGRSNREVARETGIPHATVDRAVTAALAS
jgi:DNA-binding NarL/FixJ family response regulator